MFSEKTLRRLEICLIFTLLAKILKGGLLMGDFKSIDNTRYVISRVFAENTTTAMLIEQRIKDIKNNTPSLTNDTTMVYNVPSGSIQSKEGL